MAIKRGLFSLRRLRWKLTLSYTLVTVAALLMLELILCGVFVAFLNSNAPTRMVANDFREVVAPRLKPHLVQTPPDIGGLREEVELLAREVGFRGTGKEPPGDGTLRITPDEGYLFVVDEDRRLLASTPGPEEFPRGERFGAGRLSEMNPLVEAALSGKEDPSLLSTNTSDSRIMTAAPVKDEGGRVVGAVAGSIRMPDMTRPLLIVVAVSVVVLLIPAAILGTIFGFLTAWSPVRRLQRLAKASEAWSRGDFSFAVKDGSKDEIGQLSRDLNHMAEHLENLVRFRQELATLEERNRVARDLHDSVKQQVFATSLQVAAARAKIGDGAEAAEVHLMQAEELVRQAQRELNVLIHEMRPAALEDRGLAPALRDYVHDWSERAEIPAAFRVRGERKTRLEVEQGVFRVAQEALANVAKHSGARHAEVELVYAGDTLTLRVADDGRGFGPEKSDDGYGLQSMSERSERLGGRFHVVSTPGKGTEIVCSCPIDGPSPSENGRT